MIHEFDAQESLREINLTVDKYYQNKIKIENYKKRFLKKQLRYTNDLLVEKLIIMITSFVEQIIKNFIYHTLSVGNNSIYVDNFIKKQYPLDTTNPKVKNLDEIMKNFHYLDVKPISKKMIPEIIKNHYSDIVRARNQIAHTASLSVLITEDHFENVIGMLHYFKMCLYSYNDPEMEWIFKIESYIEQIDSSNKVISTTSFYMDIIESTKINLILEQQ